MKKGPLGPFIFVMTPQTYLFDLDGTLLDSAPDLAAAANHLREVRHLEPLPFEVLRKTASSGARGLLGAAFGIKPEDPGYKALANEFLDYYQEHMTDHSELFAGILELINSIEAKGFAWGIVTNKHARFVLPLIEHLKLTPGAVVCGDTLSVSKPHPEPIIHALRLLQKPAESAVYVGDDLRDIQAANSAHVFSIAAQWGYLGSPVGVEEWKADAIVRNPSQILEINI